jgi:hypothetical protein
VSRRPDWGRAFLFGYLAGWILVGVVCVALAPKLLALAEAIVVAWAALGTAAILAWTFVALVRGALEALRR